MNKELNEKQIAKLAEIGDVNEKYCDLFIRKDDETSFGFYITAFLDGKYHVSCLKMWYDADFNSYRDKTFTILRKGDFNKVVKRIKQAIA